MPRASRHFLPSQFWHITRRCGRDISVARAARRLCEHFWHRKPCSPGVAGSQGFLDFAPRGTGRHQGPEDQVERH